MQSSTPSGEALDVSPPDEAGGHALGRHADGLRGGGIQGALGKCLGMRDSVAGFEMADNPFCPGRAQFGQQDISSQKMQGALGGEIEAALQAGKDAGEKIVHAAQTLGLGMDEIAPSPNQQPDIEIDLGGGFHRTQIGSHWDLIGDGAGVARIGLVLAADRARLTARPGT